jgi:hypothetical protein
MPDEYLEGTAVGPGTALGVAAGPVAGAPTSRWVRIRIPDGVRGKAELAFGAPIPIRNGCDRIETLVDA